MTLLDARAIERLGQLAEAEAQAELGLEDALTTAARSEAPELRRLALEAIVQLAYRRAFVFSEAAAETARTATRDLAPAVRAEAAVLIAVLELQDPPAIDALFTLLEDDQALVRREAAAALGDLGLLHAAHRLAEHLDDEDEDTRFEAAIALASLKDPRGRDLLVRALTSDRERMTAVEALGKLGDRTVVPVLWRFSRKLFLPWEERLTLWATLYLLGEGEAADKLITRTRSRRREERAFALALIGRHRIEAGRARLAEVLREPPSPVTTAALLALGELGGDEARTQLEAAAHTPSWPSELRDDAQRALRELLARPREAKPAEG